MCAKFIEIVKTKVTHTGSDSDIKAYNVLEKENSLLPLWELLEINANPNYSLESYDPFARKINKSLLCLAFAKRKQDCMVLLIKFGARFTLSLFDSYFNAAHNLAWNGNDDDLKFNCSFLLILKLDEGELEKNNKFIKPENLDGAKAFFHNFQVNFDKLVDIFYELVTMQQQRLKHKYAIDWRGILECEVERQPEYILDQFLTLRDDALAARVRSEVLKKIENDINIVH